MWDLVGNPGDRFSQNEAHVGPDQELFNRSLHAPFASTCTVKVLTIRTPKMFAVINLKFKQRGFSMEKFIQNVLIERQTVQTLIRLLLVEQSDLGLHCLPRPVCTKT